MIKAILVCALVASAVAQFNIVKPQSNLLVPLPVKKVVTVKTYRYNTGSGANDGRYYGGDDGKYHPDDSGKYVHDGSGAYSGDYEKYKHTPDQFGNSGANYNQQRPGQGQGGVVTVTTVSNQYGINGANGQGQGHGVGFGVSGQVHGNGVAFGQAGNGNGQAGFIQIGHGQGAGQHGAGQHGAGHVVVGHGAGHGQAGAGQNVYVQHGNAAGYYDNRNYGIIRKVEQVDTDGYHYVYETENGITGEEQGKLANKGTPEEAMRASGYYTYTGPDNVVYTVEYTADENGFQPRGAHIPKIPEAIVRSLEYQKSKGLL